MDLTGCCALWRKGIDCMCADAAEQSAAWDDDPSWIAEQNQRADLFDYPGEYSDLDGDDVYEGLGSW